MSRFFTHKFTPSRQIYALPGSNGEQLPRYPVLPCHGIETVSKGLETRHSCAPRTDEEAGAHGQWTEHERPAWSLGIRDALLACGMVILIQGLLVVLEMILKRLSIAFPAAILAMILMFVACSVTSIFWQGLEGLYKKHLTGPASVLNRHMSIGFVVPLIMICHSAMTDGRGIGLIIAGFVLTGLFSGPSTYVGAYFLQAALAGWGTRRKRIPNMRQGNTGDIESNGEALKTDRGPQGTVSSRVSEMESKPGCVPPSPWLTSAPTSPPAVRLSSASPPASFSLKMAQAKNESVSKDTGPSPEAGHGTLSPLPKRGRAFLRWACRNPELLLSWLLALMVGLPTRLAVQTVPVNMVPLQTLLLFAGWLSMVKIQAEAARRSERKRSKSSNKAIDSCVHAFKVVLASCLNAVLTTALAMMSYAWVEAFFTDRTVDKVLDQFRTNVTVADLILGNTDQNIAHLSSSTRHAHAFAAGDLALCVLNAGLVSWGLKLYEYRRQLLISAAGLTVAIVSCASALGSLLLGPLLARAIGIGPSASDLAFAARSVSLAFGSPALIALAGGQGGGSGVDFLGLNATMVVASGIIWQMGLGLGVGRMLERWTATLGCVRWLDGMGTRNSHLCPDSETADGGVETHGHGSRPHNRNAGGNPIKSCAAHKSTPRTVAAGVAIGINAAAMGTAHLYEAHSSAAPYAVMAMTIFGTMTVVGASTGPLARWVVGAVGGL